MKEYQFYVVVTSCSEYPQVFNATHYSVCDGELTVYSRCSTLATFAKGFWQHIVRGKELPQATPSN
jgi:hypothetical protein